MKTKGNKENSNKIKRKISIITVFLWLFLVVTMVMVVSKNIKNTNALENDNVSIYTDINENVNIYEDQIKQRILKPNKPTINDIPATDSNGYVYVKCIDNEKHVGRIGIRNSSDGWKFGEVKENDGRFGSDIPAEAYPWMCELILDKEYYKELFNKSFSNQYGMHYVEASNNIVSTWLVSDGKSWYYIIEEFPMTVWITHEEAIKYTVKYTDGLEDETVFQDQEYSDLYANVKTPEFKGTPTRNGYEFVGWSPEVNEVIDPKDCSYDNIITYTARWVSILNRDDLHRILRYFVKVHCVDNEHDDKLYSTWGGSFNGLYESTVGDVYYSEEQKKYLCDVTLNGEVYNYMYKFEPSFGVGEEHHLVKDNNFNEPAIYDEDTKKTITLYYDEEAEKWRKPDNLELPIIFNVRSGASPWTPKREDLSNIIGDNFARVHCVSNPDHYDKDKYYSIVNDIIVNDEYEATIGNIYYSQERKAYLCNIDLNGNIYCEKYSSDIGDYHKLDVSETLYKEIVLCYNGKKWKVLDDTELPITFNVRCNYANVEGFYKVNHEYYLKDENDNMILEKTSNSESVKIVYSYGERIEVGLPSVFNKVDIEVDKIPTCIIDNVNYTYEYLENSGNVILEENALKEITLKYVRDMSNEVRIKVEKIWEDENNKYGKRPESVILQLKNGEEIIAEMEVTEENSWSSEFVVPKYDKDRNEIKYTVDEKETNEFYEKTIDGYKVINKYIGEEQKDENNNEIKNDEENNINTSDINIFIYLAVFCVSIIEVVTLIIFVRKNKIIEK